MNDIIPPPVFTSRMVRELKGAPLSVFILLILADQPVSNGWLCRMSGYSDKPVAQALDLLASPEYQLAVKTFGGWRIADNSNLFLISRRNSVPTTTAIDTTESNKDSKAVVVSRKNSDSPDDRFLEIWNACKEVGIGDPSASTIAGLTHATPDLVRAHVSALTKGERIGLAITRIKNNEPPRMKASERSGAKYVQGAYAEFIEH